MPVVVRIYVVQGINLRPRDKHDFSDAYLKIEYGGSKVLKHFFLFGIFITIFQQT